MRRIAGLIVVALTVGTAGCLINDITHTLYLTPAGAVTWTATQTVVRSNENTAAKRQVEEQQFLDAIAAETHPIAQGFRALGGERIRTRLIRAHRPYTAVTDAEFARVDRLVEGALAGLRIPGLVTLEPRGGRQVLTIAVDLSAIDRQPAGDEHPAEGLIESLDRYRVVLTDGHFVDATGFHISDDATVAVPVELSEEDLAAAGWRVTLSLTWTTAVAIPGGV